jgi:uncharacterized membrane protein YhaH (DUF805 family)
MNLTLAINPLIAIAVLASTAVTDAAYVFFNAAVGARRRVRAANWSAIWYLLSAFAVISYTENPIYVAFAAIGLVARRVRIGDMVGARGAGGPSASRSALNP